MTQHTLLPFATLLSIEHKNGRTKKLEIRHWQYWCHSENEAVGQAMSDAEEQIKKRETEEQANLMPENGVKDFSASKLLTHIVDLSLGLDKAISYLNVLYKLVENTNSKYPSDHKVKFGELPKFTQIQ